MKRSSFFLYNLLLIFIFSSFTPVPGLASRNTPASGNLSLHRIVSLAPNLTEILFALGAGKRVVGVSSFDTYPPEVQKLPRLGGYFNPDIERLVQLKPDMVFILDGKQALEQKLGKFGIACRSFHCVSLEDIFAVISRMGTLLSIQSRADTLLARLHDAVTRFTIPGDKRPKTLIVVGTSPGSMQKMYVAGGGSFLDDLAEIAGAVNVFHDQPQAYFEVSKESIIAAQPDIIIVLSPGSESSPEARRKTRARWTVFRAIPAVRNERIYIFTEDYLLIPGPRFTKTLEKFSSIFTAWRDAQKL